jgi:hypothetical protein
VATFGWGCHLDVISVGICHPPAIHFHSGPGPVFLLPPFFSFSPVCSDDELYATGSVPSIAVAVF